MFYLLQYLGEDTPLRIFQYVTFRTFMAAGTAFALCLLFGPMMIRGLRRLKIGQHVREEMLDTHKGKAGTPTMGGVLILFSVTISCLLWGVITNRLMWLALLTMLFMGGVGFLDDYLKIKKRQSEGLDVKGKFALQIIWSIVAVLFLWFNEDTKPLVDRLMLPFMKDPLIASMGIVGALVFHGIVIVGASNAVNLTDGLDGLAIGCSNAVVLAYLIFSYVAGHAVFAEYLSVPYVAGAEELTVVCGALLGGGLGFLWFNAHPARVFMGDTGSLALGGVIAVIAIMTLQELVLLIVGAVFVIEACSVIIQVGWFKFTRKKYGEGRRVFRRAPIHHHFELLEKERARNENRDVEVIETLITIRFWIISIICALLGVATLKLR